MTWKGWEDYNPPVLRAKDLGAQVTTSAAVTRSKYGAQPQWVLADLRVMRADDAPLPGGAIWFASKREAMRFVALRQELEAGTISELTLQPQFPLGVVNAHGVRVVIGRYVSDFSYLRDGKRIVEDVKGARTVLYEWKRKHVAAEYGIRIVET